MRYKRGGMKMEELMLKKQIEELAEEILDKPIEIFVKEAKEKNRLIPELTIYEMIISRAKLIMGIK